MTIAMILSLLLGSGVCARSDFQGPDGRTLHVIVCPVLGGDEAPDEEAPPPTPRDGRRWPS